MTENLRQVRGRRFRGALSQEALAAIQSGVMRTTYRGRPFLKSPFDIALYSQLIARVRPATIIEIGAKSGGSALWFADTLTAHGLDPRVVSIDLTPPADLADPRITFLRGDAHDLGAALDTASLRHPWIVSEDSAHTFAAASAVLRFFDPLLHAGDYIVIEDGVVADLPGAHYAAYEDGPNRAVEDFLATTGDRYDIDVALCDQFRQARFRRSPA